MSDLEDEGRFPAGQLLTAPLLLVVVFALALTLAASAGVFGIPMAVILGSWFLKYAFVLLDHCANGRPEAPVLTLEQANPLGETRPLLYAAALAAGYAATGAIGALLGPPAASWLRLAGLLALPGVLTTHVVTGSFASAIHPPTVLAVIRRMGASYLTVLAAAACCGWAAHAILIGSSNLLLFARIALLMALWLAMFMLLGTLIHRRRIELGFEPEYSRERIGLRASRERERDRFVDQLFAEARSGATARAWQSIARRIEGSADRPAELHWIYLRLATWPDPRLASRVARELLALQLAAQRNGAALDLARQRVAADASFRPDTAAQALRIAELARAAGDRALARAMLGDFAARYPDEAARGAAARMAADLDLR